VATRFYFPASELSPVSPSYDAGWSSSAQGKRRRLAHIKASSTVATDGNITLPGAAGEKNLDRQYISDPIKGGTISGTLKCQIMAKESATNDNVDEGWLQVCVVSGDGQTSRGILLSIGHYGITSEYSTGARNKTLANGDTVSSVTAQDGDRIVVEMGHSNSTAGTSIGATFYYGENGTDLPESEVGTTGAGWIEFSATIVMMKSRFWFPKDEPAAVSPGYDTWTDTSEALRRRLAHVKGASALGAGSLITLSGAAGAADLDRQYVSDPIRGRLISGWCKCQLIVYQQQVADNLDQLWLAVRVVSEDGATLRGELLNRLHYGITSDYGVGFLGRLNKTAADGDLMTSVTALDMDRIVVELAHSNVNTGSVPQGIGYWGEAGDDLPEDETTTSGAGWIDLIIGEPITMFSTISELRQFENPILRKRRPKPY